MPSADQNISLDRYQIIPRVLVFASRGENLLLIQGSPNKKTYPNLFNGIGGHIEMGEDVLSAARREFVEETGLELIKPYLCMVILVDTNRNPGIGLFVIKASVGEGTLKKSQEGKPEWIKPARLDRYPLVEDLPILIPKILEVNPGDHVLFAHYQYSKSGKLKITFSD